MMTSVPARDPLPRYLAPLPESLEDFGLRMALPIAVINFIGTAFGFWYYGIQPFSEPRIVGQFAREPLLAWPVVPDSPTATLFIGLSLLLWWLGRPKEWLNMLAFFGCLKLGLWTPIVLLLFRDGFSYLHPAMYHFLFWSHLAMVLEAFLIYRYSDFPVRAVGVAVLWYGFNDVVDYFVPIVGDHPHHTAIPPEFVDGTITHGVAAHDQAAAVAVSLTFMATFLALSTRVKKLETRGPD